MWFNPTSLAGTSKFSIGKSYQSTDIYAIKFGSGERNVVINGGIHAREWLAPSTTTWLANELLKNTTESIRLRSIYT